MWWFGGASLMVEKMNEWVEQLHFPPLWFFELFCCFFLFYFVLFRSFFPHGTAGLPFLSGKGSPADRWGMQIIDQKQTKNSVFYKENCTQGCAPGGAQNPLFHAESMFLHARARVRACAYLPWYAARFWWSRRAPGAHLLQHCTHTVPCRIIAICSQPLRTHVWKNMQNTAKTSTGAHHKL